MSHVTDIIVITPVDEKDFVNALNAFLPFPLKEISDHAGGSKALQADIWAGAYNLLDLDKFMDHAQTCIVRHPAETGTIHLLVKDEHDLGFHITTRYPDDSLALETFS